MRLYQNKILIFVFILVLGILTTVLLFDNSSLSNDVLNSNAIVNTRVGVLPVAESNCSFQLHAGWNLVSFYCLGLFNDRSVVLESINDSYSVIFDYHSNDVSDPWKSYNPNLPNWTIQQLDHMNRISGYWIYMNDNATFFYSGIYTDSLIPLSSGWNLVGYPNTNSTDINYSLSNISFSVVKYYDTQTNTWLVYYTNGTKNLNQFDTYKGYWINVSGIQQWSITKN